MTQTDQELDRIERSIDIDATAEKVWSLIERPGWWINEGEIESDREVRREGEADVVVHPKYGEFRLLTLASEPPRHLAVTWLDGDADAGTRVEFTVADRAEGGVTLTVVESGFADLGKPRSDVIKHVEENTSGWEAELDLARRHVTGANA
ncbi:SRPBCC domain-containing protein [Nocardioides jensenii]|uniref:SRPBCC domain-containing protein n=1 Tax=Nocardioides jensenii TaxID=1843 RepID=UPI0008327800|nr:SRPBCC domain-containing protein [Nocardioides jensenii]